MPGPCSFNCIVIHVGLDEIRLENFDSGQSSDSVYTTRTLSYTFLSHLSYLACVDNFKFTQIRAPRNLVAAAIACNDPYGRDYVLL